MRFPLSSLGGRVEAISLYVLAAIPGIAVPKFRQAAPAPPNDIVLVVLGCVVLVAFGVILGLIWNRFNAGQRRS